MLPWYQIANSDEVPSPALLIYPTRVEENIRHMVELAGRPERLFPHVKTHKLPQLVRLQQAHGIQKFKCATIAEAEMVAGCKAERVLLAYQPVGPNVARLVELAARFPGAQFGALVDNLTSARALSAAAEASAVSLELFIDLDVGMHRTGIEPGPAAIELYQLICRLPGVSAGGIHAYDGHLHDADFEARRAKARAAFATAQAFRAELQARGLSVPRVIAGGTPTFPIHAREHDVDCSPGTCVFMDTTSAAVMTNTRFVPAAAILTRVISKPAGNRLCLDLGHKAIASENPHPRVHLFALPDATAVVHSEEHLVVETARASDFAVGDALYGIPRHICPTVALHSDVIVVENGRASDRWKVLARDRVLTV